MQPALFCPKKTCKELTRFWNKVNKESLTMPHMDTPCWEWTASLKKGYGQFQLGVGQSIKSHRYSWIIHNGSIPDGLWVLHHCDNPKCVNPSHLYLGTKWDNAKDKVKRNKSFRPLGEKYGAHKITSEQVLKIRELYGSGDFTQQYLANMFNISRPHISIIINRKAWNHI